MGSMTMAPKIGKCLRLLASPTPGERLAAVSALNRTLKRAGLDFHDLAAAAEDGLMKPIAPKATGASTSNLDMALWLRNAKLGNLKANERDFVISTIRLLAYGHELSEKQLRWLTAIFLAMGGKI